MKKRNVISRFVEFILIWMFWILAKIIAFLHKEDEERDDEE